MFFFTNNFFSIAPGEVVAQDLVFPGPALERCRDAPRAANQQERFVY